MQTKDPAKEVLKLLFFRQIYYLLVGLEWDDSTLDGPSSPGPSNGQRHTKGGAHRV